MKGTSEEPRVAMLAREQVTTRDGEKLATTATNAAAEMIFSSLWLRALMKDPRFPSALAKEVERQATTLDNAARRLSDAAGGKR